MELRAIGILYATYFSRGSVSLLGFNRWDSYFVYKREIPMLACAVCWGMKFITSLLSTIFPVLPTHAVRNTPQLLSSSCPKNSCNVYVYRGEMGEMRHMVYSTRRILYDIIIIRAVLSSFGKVAILIRHFLSCLYSHLNCPFQMFRTCISCPVEHLRLPFVIRMSDRLECQQI